MNLPRLDRQIGLLAAALPDSTVLGVCVEQSGWWEDHRVWWYTGGHAARSGEVVRADTALADRRVEVGEFTLQSFVCGEVYDAGGGFDPAWDAGGCDVVAVSAHTSVVRLRDRHGEPPQRYAFHRAFRRIGRTCGGVLAHAHEQDDGGYVRRQDNWVVYRGAAPFPEVQVIALRPTVGIMQPPPMKLQENKPGKQAPSSINCGC